MLAGCWQLFCGLDGPSSANPGPIGHCRGKGGPTSSLRSMTVKRSGRVCWLASRSGRDSLQVTCKFNRPANKPLEPTGFAGGSTPGRYTNSFARSCDGRRTDKGRVAEIISTFLCGGGGAWDWDDFVSIRIRDPFLEAIRVQCADLPRHYPRSLPEHYCGDEGMSVLHSIAELYGVPSYNFRMNPTGEPPAGYPERRTSRQKPGKRFESRSR